MSPAKQARALLAWCAVFCAVLASPLQAAGVSGDADRTLAVGVRVDALRELSIQRHEFTLTGLIWWRHADAGFDALRGTRLIGPGELRLTERARVRSPEGGYLTEAFFEARVSQEINTENYPYDKHRLKFVLETGNPEKQDRLVPDIRSSGLGKSPVGSDWALSAFSIETGRSGLAGSTTALPRPSIAVVVQADRTNRRALFDHFIGFFVAQFLCLIGFLINPALLQQRITVATPAIFVAVGYKIVNNTVLGTSFSFLSASLSVGSFFMIVLYLVVSVSLAKLHDSGQPRRARKLNDIAAALFLVIWLGWLAAIFGFIRGFGPPGSV